MGTVVSIADYMSSGSGLARARWFKEQPAPPPKRWGPMAEDERLLALILGTLPHRRGGFIRGMLEIASSGQDVTEKQVIALLDAGLNHGVIEKVNEGQPDEGWTFTQQGMDITEGLPASLFLEWLQTQGLPYCGALTKTGRPCGNAISDRLKPREWLDLHRKGICARHQRMAIGAGRS
jgi:hypothetical protein